MQMFCIHIKVILCLVLITTTKYNIVSGISLKSYLKTCFFPAFADVMMVNVTTWDYDCFPPDPCPLFQAVFYSIVCGTVCLPGLVGNAISFAVLRFDTSMPVASFQLRSLAVVDSIFLVLWIVHYSFRYTVQYVGSAIGISVCLFIRICTFPLLYMAQMGTIWFTVALGLSRYLAVCTPYCARRLCSMVYIRRATYTIAAFSVAYNLPRYLEIKTSQTEKAYLCYNRTSLGHNALYKLIYTDVLYCIVTFSLPLVSLAFMNTRVIVSYREISRRRSRIVSQSSQATDNECSITLVMIIIVAVFIACHLPARLIQTVFTYDKADCPHPRYYWIHVSNVLEVLNSSVNFLIYWACHKQFRRILPCKLCCRLRRGPTENLPDDTASQGILKNGGTTSTTHCMSVLDRQQTQLNTGVNHEATQV